MTALWIIVAAAIGAAIRAAVTDLDGTFNRQLLGTLAVNTAGAFLLGILTASDVASETLKVIGIGLLGALTTFSTAIAQVESIGQKSPKQAIGYGLGSLALILAAAWIGHSL